MIKANHRVLIVIPVYNERPYVRDVLREVRKSSQDILVVDDGSVDGTADVLKREDGIRVLSHDRNLGYGRALIDGFAYADTNGYDWVITMDCDHQHEPSFLSRFSMEIERDDADIISGSRYLSGSSQAGLPPPRERREINRQMTELVNKWLRLQLTDSFCGFKAYRTRSVVSLELTEEGYGFPLQFWVKASLAGLRIREIAVPLIYHDPGRNFKGVLEDATERWKYYLTILRRELSVHADQDDVTFVRS